MHVSGTTLLFLRTEAEDEEAVSNIVVSMQSAEETRSSMLEFRRLIEKTREWNDASVMPQNIGPIHPHMQVLPRANEGEGEEKK